MAEDWVVVRNCLNVYEAFLLRSVLEGSGIECYLPDENVATIRPGAEVALGGVRVLVHGADFTRADEVLSSAPPASSADDVNGNGESQL